jgi:HEAT repeat protein
MLFHDNPMAREVLLDALKNSGNSAARLAVCKSLIKARLSKDEVRNKSDFIDPLLSILSTNETEEAQLAAEAMLIFEYDNIGESLENITTDSSKPVKMRINAINALKLWPNMEATIRLIRLVDDPEKTVSSEAEKALRSLGIPVGEDYWARQQNISELQGKGRDEFMRDWLIRQESQMRQMRAEVRRWQERYLSALDTIYNGMSDDVAKGKFLQEHLGSSEAGIKLWALDKVYKWQFASGRPKLPAELEPVLLNLISDSVAQVRLKTLGLSVLRRMDSAEPLLAQLKSESNEKVEVALLDALGGACSNALSFSPARIKPEIRKQALEFAVRFLLEEETAKSRKGAEVLQKLLVPDGLQQDEVEGYLDLLLKRYEQQEQNPDTALRGELLSAMAGLCAPGSSCRDMAAERFEPIFVEALGGETDFVRETAVDGLIYIDKVDALRRLREQFYDDSSEVLRKKLINLAAAAGDKEDLPKLAAKIGSNSESRPAWQAMLKIFDGSAPATLKEWMDKLISATSQVRLSDEQKIAFLKKVEAKAGGDEEMLASVAENLADLYYKAGQFERAAEYLERQYNTAATAKAKDAILAKLLDASLKSSKVDVAAKLVEECLAKGDLSTDHVVLDSLSKYLVKPSGADAGAVLEALSGVKFSGERPKWQQWLKSWTERLGKSEGAEESKEAAKANQA